MKRGFTLIELLVVIAIIAVLAAILFPVFARAREKARQTTCTSNQRQLAASIQMFVQDHEETMPQSSTVWQDLNVDAGILICPTKGKSVPNGYVYSALVAGQAMGQIPTPDQTMLTADGISSTKISKPKNVAYGSAQFDPRHSGKWVQAYADGHVAMTNVTPDFLPIKDSSLVLWMQARVFAGYAGYGGAINAWNSSAGNLSFAKGSGNAPTFDPAGINGCPSIHFESQTPAQNYVMAPMNVSDCSIFLAAQDTIGRGYSGRFFDAGSNINFSIRKAGTAGQFQASVRQNIGGYIDNNATVSAVTEGVPHVMAFRRQAAAATHQFYIDGQEASATGDITGTMNQAGWVWRMGCYSDNQNGAQLQGDIGEILVYNRSFTTADRDTILQYLRDQFNL